MQILSRSTLRSFWTIHPDAEGPLKAWYGRVQAAAWATPAELKSDFGSNVDFVSDNRVIFDVGGNKFRLIVRVAYPLRRVMIKFVGTHAEYDAIDPETV